MNSKELSRWMMILILTTLFVAGCSSQSVIQPTKTAMPVPTKLSIATVSWTPSATLAPVFTVTPVPTSGPTPSGGGAGQIVFCGNSGPKGKIYLVDMDGENLHQLTANPDAGSCHPAWSPDGQQIAFESFDSDGVSQIYIMDADGSHPAALTNSQVSGSASDPQWSPDGKRIAFVSTLYASNLEACSNFLASCNVEIFVMNTDGTGLTRLTNNSVDDGAPVWSPDGSKIAFYSALDEPDPEHCSYADCNYEIYTMDPDGTELTRLTDSPTKDLWPAWSPDGRQIAFTSLRDEPQPASCLWTQCIDEIYIMNVDGTGVKRLTNDNQLSWFPAWSPDGTKITYSAYHLDSTNPDSMWDIVVMDSDGSHPMMLTKDMGAIVSAWRP